ncbi:hypothetical protein CsSME_00048679 [Camellia sinensis var. sinensis]
MEQRLCEAAIDGNVESLDEIIGADQLILDKVVVGCINPNPLHVATTLGRTQFVQRLVHLKPELVEVLDSRYRSALHLATTKGHFDIVQALVRVREGRQMCLARDRDGKNPLHIAAMEGHGRTLEVLVGTIPHAARVRLDSGETILHLCVKHQQLNTLSLLLHKIPDPEFVNAKDNDGNTILHVAVSGQQFEIVKHVLQNTKIDVNATNAYGHTAMDILFLAQNGADSEGLHGNIEDFLRNSKAKRAKDLVQGEWISKKREALMIVASLIATMAFQAGVSPPGGVWQDDSNGHRAGEAVMAYNYKDSYPYFLRANTIGLVSSLSIILLLISGLPFRKRSFMLALVMIMWLTITSMAFTYAFSIVVVTPKKYRKSLTSTIVVAVIVWCSVMALLLLVHTVHLIMKMLGERRSRNKAMERIFNFGINQPHSGQPRARPNLVKEIQLNI